MASSTMTQPTQASEVRTWMVRPDGLAFFRFPVEEKNTVRLAAVLLEYPEHRLETKGQFLGVFRT